MDEMTLEQQKALAHARARMRMAQAQEQQPVQEPKSRTWGQIPGEALGNLPSSAADFAGGMYQAVRHPIDTATGLVDIAAGGLRNAMPDSVVNLIEGGKPNPSALRASEMAGKVGGMYKDRYGSMEGFKNTLATDPVGFAGDLSAVLYGAGGLARKVPMLTKPINAAGAVFNSPADALTRAGNAVNPINALKYPAKAAGWTGKQMLGLTTLQGPENISQAAKAGFTGDKNFINNMNGKVPMNQVLDDAFTGLKTMKEKASIGYNKGMAGVRADQTMLNFSDIDSTLYKQMKSLQVKSRTSGQTKFVVGDDQMKVLQDLDGIVKQWRIDKGLHTPEGLDALKRRIESVPSEYGTAADKVKTALYNSVKDTIIKQAPEYKETMAAYEAAKKMEKELTKTLSLNKNATEDTALRKLQSVARNNVNANYGQRLNLLNTLEKEGGVNLSSALAGQSMSPWMSRGLVGQGGMLGSTIGAAVTGNIAPLGMLPAMSPRVVGGMLYYGGRPIGAVNDLMTRYGIKAEDIAKYGLLGTEAAKIQQ